MEFTDRRRYQRVRLGAQLRGRVGEVRVVVADVSRSGLLILHQVTLGAVGTTCELRFDWDGHPIALQCVIVRTAIRHPAKTPTDKPLLESGVRITSASPEMAARLRMLIEDHVLRALDERRANAKGIPATAAQSFQTGQVNQLVRHEFLNGTWRSWATTSPQQPAEGFTLSAEEPLANVEMLRETFVSADASARAIIRQMAAMSISKTEGIPTRRYEP